MFCIQEVVELKGSFAIISQQCSTASHERRLLKLLILKHAHVLTLHPLSTVANSFNLTPRWAPTASACSYTVHFLKHRGLSQCVPVTDGPWHGSSTEHLTISLPVESSWMPPRSTWGIGVMLEKSAAADGRQIVKARAWFVLNNLLMSFLKGKQLKNFTPIWPKNRF